MRNLFRHPTYVALGLTVVAAFVAARFEFKELSLRGLEAAELGTLFLALMFTALVIERAVEVYVSNRYDPEEMNIQRDIREAQQRLTLLEEALAREVAQPGPPSGDPSSAAASKDKSDTIAGLRREVVDAREAVRTAKVAALNDQIDLETRKTAAAGAIATVLGVVAASAGIRIFGQFVELEDGGMPAALTGTAYQLTWFRFGDVLLSALVLAGGADGIHQLVKDFLSKRNTLRPTG